MHEPGRSHVMIEDDDKLAQLDAELTAGIIRYLNGGGTIEHA
jgi:hypothetical protein